MMSDDLRLWLNDYVDGALSEAEAQAVEALLAADETARKEVAFLRRLAAETRRLPRAIAPGRDLWDGIASEIAGPEQRRSLWRHRAFLGAAAVVLVALSSMLTAFWLRRDTAPQVARTAPSVAPAPSSSMAAFQASEHSYSLAVAQLSQTLAERRHDLAPETVAAIEANLKLIDEAIRASRKALDADPNNQQSMHTILSMYRKKVDVLQQVVDWPSGG